MEERIFKPKEVIASLGHPELMDCLLFVSRGRVIEKIGDYDDNTPEIVYKQGSIVHMNLLLEKGNNKSKTTIYCHEDSRAGVVRINHTQLANILEDDKENMMP